MNKVFRAVATAVAAMMLLGMLAMPASADTNATAVINGVAEVGKWFSEHCGKDGVATVTGRGLYLPNLKTVPGVANGNREEHGVFHFKSVAAAIVATNQVGSTPHPATVTVEVCGYLSPITGAAGVPGKPAREDGLGAACGISKGHDGRGWVTDPTTTPAQIVQLQEVGWVTSAGGTLPVTGKYVEIVEGPNTKKTKDVLVDPEEKGKGSLVAAIQAQGGAGCTGLKTPQTNNGNGAQTFNVVGSAELINDVNGVANTGDKCKEDGAPAGMDGVKKSHANKPNTNAGACPDKEED